MAPISIFSKNFGTKVTALLLALVVYAHVYTEREHERRLRIPLHVRGLSSDLILVKSPPEDVEVQVRGKGKQLLKFQFRPPHVELDLAEARPGEIQRMLSPADVILPLGMDVNVTEVRAPRLVSFQIDTLATKSVPVVINQLGELPERLGWIEPLKSDPPTALITGPSRKLDAIEAVGTEPIDLGSISGIQTIGLSLDFSPPVQTIEPTQVSVKVEVGPIEELNLGMVPVVLERLKKNRWATVIPDSAMVLVAGPAELLSRLESTPLTLTIDLEGLEEGFFMLPSELGLPYENIKVTAVVPSEFEVEIGAAPR